MRLSYIAVAAALVTAIPAWGQQTENIFANPKNLKVLPKDISPDELRETMRGFAFATGQRCAGCHAAIDDTPDSKLDFPSDVKENKRIAREMIRMVRKINETIGKIDGVDANDRVAVRCTTCHRGIPRPTLIQDVLDGYKLKDDSAGAVTKYEELREMYYGSHSYDFTVLTLGDYAETASEEGAVAFASALHELNRTLNPDAAYAYVAWGNSLMHQKDFQGAMAAYERAATLRPDNEFYKRLLQRAKDALQNAN